MICILSLCINYWFVSVLVQCSPSTECSAGHSRETVCIFATANTTFDVIYYTYITYKNIILVTFKFLLHRLVMFLTVGVAYNL